MILDPTGGSGRPSSRRQRFRPASQHCCQSWFSSFAVRLLADWLRKKPAIMPPNPRKVCPLAMFDDGVDHRRVDHALGHLAHGARRHVQDEQGVEIRRAGLLADLRFALGQCLGDGTRHEALGIHPADMIGSFTPNVVGLPGAMHLMAEQHGHFGVGHVLDVDRSGSGRAQGRRRNRRSCTSPATARGIAGQRQVLRHWSPTSQRPHAGFRTAMRWRPRRNGGRCSGRNRCARSCIRVRRAEPWRSP